MVSHTTLRKVPTAAIQADSHPPTKKIVHESFSAAYPGSMTRLKADGPSILRIGFDPERLSELRGTKVEDIAYHIARVLTGEARAVVE
jgi:hypothetical protein